MPATAYLELRPALWRSGVGLCRDPDLTKDLASEAFIRGWVYVAHHPPPEDLYAWLVRVLHNVYIDHLRREANQAHGSTHAVRAALDQDWCAVHTSGHCAEFTQRVVDVEALLIALGGLSRRSREILICTSALGLTTAETAELLDLPLGKVAVVAHRARRLSNKLQAAQGSLET